MANETESRIQVTIGDYQEINVVLGENINAYIKIKKQFCNGTNTTWADAINSTCLLENIVIHETEGNAITGLKIGTTNGGEQIVSSHNYSGNDTYVFEPNFDINWSSNVTIYITATAWGTGKVDVYLKLINLLPETA